MCDTFKKSIRRKEKCDSLIQRDIHTSTHAHMQAHTQHLHAHTVVKTGSIHSHTQDGRQEESMNNTLPTFL